MTDTRNLFHLQCAAKLKRADTMEQYTMAWEMLSHDLGDTEILIAMERKYFIGRKTATETLERARKDLHDLDNW